MTLLQIEEPLVAQAPAPWQASHPVWRLGFRPFYLLAAVFAALSVPLWLAHYLGWSSGWPHVDLGWHMHEMVFGMALAVIVGFLYTAGRNWTGLDTPQGAALAALAGLWLAGRGAMLALPALPAALLDLAFLPIAAWPLYRVLAQSGNKRNMFLIGLLALLTLANAAYHAATLGWLHLAQATPIQAAILVIVVMESVIGARVIPMFTRNGAPGTEPVVRPGRDKLAVVLLVATVLAWLLNVWAPVMAVLAIAAAVVTALRLWGWQPHRTGSVPLLWILHLSYAWIPFGLLLLAGAAFGVVSTSVAFHALTVGSMAGLIIGMITRTTLGHTGRPLKSGLAEVAMYLLVQAGAVLRLLAGLDLPTVRVACLVLAGTCWSVAFALYVLVYAPYLWRARVDGKAG